MAPWIQKNKALKVTQIIFKCNMIQLENRNLQMAMSATQ